MAHLHWPTPQPETEPSPWEPVERLRNRDLGEAARRTILGLFGVKIGPGQRSGTLQALLDAEAQEGTTPQLKRWPTTFEGELNALRPTLRPPRAYGGGTYVAPEPELETAAQRLMRESREAAEARRREVMLARAKRERMRMGLIDDDERRERAAWVAEARAAALPVPVPLPPQRLPPPSIRSALDCPVDSTPGEAERATMRQQLDEEYLRVESIAMAALDAQAKARAAVASVSTAVTGALQVVDTYRGKAWELVAGANAETAPWEESNVAGIGSVDDRALRKAAAQTEPAWRGCGARPGLEIWRVQQFKMVPWPKEDYGQFYEGDSYIVLHTIDPEEADADADVAPPGGPGAHRARVGGSSGASAVEATGGRRELHHHIYFWLGLQSSVDEQGTAAYKTVELDDLFDGRCVQHREVMMHESEAFKALFPRIVYLKGGVASGFRHVVDLGAYPTKLLQARLDSPRLPLISSPLASPPALAYPSPSPPLDRLPSPRLTLPRSAIERCRLRRRGGAPWWSRSRAPVRHSTTGMRSSSTRGPASTLGLARSARRSSAPLRAWPPRPSSPHELARRSPLTPSMPPFGRRSAARGRSPAPLTPSTCCPSLSRQATVCSIGSRTRRALSRSQRWHVATFIRCLPSPRHLT